MYVIYENMSKRIMDGSPNWDEVSVMRLKLYHNHPQGLRITHHKTPPHSDTCITAACGSLFASPRHGWKLKMSEKVIEIDKNDYKNMNQWSGKMMKRWWKSTWHPIANRNWIVYFSFFTLSLQYSFLQILAKNYKLIEINCPA